MSVLKRSEVEAGRQMVARAAWAVAQGLARLSDQVAGAKDAPGHTPLAEFLDGTKFKYGEHWLPGDVPSARSVILNAADPDVFEVSGKADCDELIAPLMTPEMTVVDLGCGIGRVALYVAQRCQTLWAVDASPGMLSMARQRLSGRDNVRFAPCLDTRVPDIRDGSVDLLYSILVLQHLEKEDAFLLMRDVVRMLAPGGHALLMFPNILSDEYLDSFIQCAEKGRECIDNSARPHFYTPPEVERVTRAAGFVSVEVKDGHNMLALCTK